jgi:hypothetical protein
VQFVITDQEKATPTTPGAKPAGGDVKFPF